MSTFTSNRAPKATNRLASHVLQEAERLRDICRAEMLACEIDPETYGDPGDAVVTINGNDKNVLSVLYILRVIGISKCE